MKFGTDEQNTYYTLLLVDAGNFLLFVFLFLICDSWRLSPPFFFFRWAKPEGKKAWRVCSLACVRRAPFSLESSHFLIFFFLFAFPAASTNIPGRKKDTDISKGTTVLEYIPPHPTRGSNLHRFVFVLFEQKDREVQVENQPTLQDRFRATSSLIEKHSLKPVGFSFFRAQWDPTVSDIYRDVLKQKEPIWSESTPSSTSTSANGANRTTRGRAR